MHDIHFGDLGLKIGDEITFIKDNKKFIVSSGNGTPDNGGTLVRYPEQGTNNLYCLRYMSRRLLADEFEETEDIFERWEYKGITLRKMWLTKNK